MKIEPLFERIEITYKIKIMDENKRKHLDYLQDIITRMNNNSFIIKGWTVGLIALILGLNKLEGFYWIPCNKYNFPLETFVILTFLLFFWYLNAFFIQQGRRFRFIYNCIIGLNTLKVGCVVPITYDMDFSRYEDVYYKKDSKTSKTNNTSLRSCFFGRTVFPIYIILIALILCFNHSQFNSKQKNEDSTIIECLKCIKK
ncbi:hypothetical protein [Myroides odoratimimus]|uniref:hypothetical protein n=1 Tax=Myroides odoratimimus TaxID=76832 RepID=UPI0031017B8B